MATVVQLLTPLQYPPGALVYRKGEVGLDMYFITHGQAEILVRNDDAEDGNQVVSVCGVARCDVFLACSHLLLRVVSRLWAPETSSARCHYYLSLIACALCERSRSCRCLLWARSMSRPC